MRNYLSNSPEAMARLIAMFMITDGDIDPRRIDVLEKIHAYDLLGIDRKRFTQVLRNYCDDISDEADEDDGVIHLMDRTRIDAMLDDVADRGKQLITCALAMHVAKSDGDISEVEITLLRHMMRSWQITLDDIGSRLQKQS
jgi:tellurite resistance protein